MAGLRHKVGRLIAGPRRKVAAIALACAVGLGAFGCTPAPNETPEVTPSATPLFNFADFPSLDGSTATIPLCVKLTQDLTGVSLTEAELACEFSTTPTSYLNLGMGSTQGEYDAETGEPLPTSGPSLLLVYEPDNATKEWLETEGIELEYHPIGRDALVFLTNSSNPVAGLTSTQLKEIYTGKLTNWKDVGGEDKAIRAFQRPESSGSQALMRKLVMGDAKLAEAPTDLIYESMSDLVEGVAGYQNSSDALGYSVYYYVTQMLTMPQVKLLAVDGVEPSSQTIAAGQYPYINDFYAVVRKSEPADSPARKLLAWLTSAEGTHLISAAGYVGLPD